MARPVDLGGKGARFITFASICLIITSLYFGRDVLIPLALAILGSFVLTPPVRWVEHAKLPRAAAALAVLLVTVALLGLIGYFFGIQFVSVIDRLPAYEGELRTKISNIRSHGGFFRKLEHEAQGLNSTASGTNPHVAPHPAAAGDSHDGAGIAQSGTPAESVTTGFPATQASADNPIAVRIVNAVTPLEALRDYGTRILDPIVTAGLVLVFILFMLVNREDLRDRMIRLVGHGRLNLTTQALDEAGTRISGYLSALSVVNASYAVLVAAGLWLIGRTLGHGRAFPNVLVWGLLVGLLRFVPYIGIWLAAAIPLVLAFALFPGSAVFFATLGMFAAMEIVVSQFVEPYWYGASTGMSALAVLVAAVFWTWLWGPIGLLLSTPLTVCLMVMGKHVPQLQFLDILLGDEPVLPPHVRVYQRLIASDEEEAAELVRSTLEEQPLEAVYDQVLIPALAMAEEDHAQDRLDRQHLDFLHQNLRDIVEELGEEEKARRAAEADAKTESETTEPNAPGEDQTVRPALPKGCQVTVLCLPAKGTADEMVGLMLTQLLEFRGYCASVASVTSLTSEMVDMIDKTRAQIVCVSAMPPAAVAHARYLCKRIQVRFAELPMSVGLWHAKGDLDKIKHRIACDDAVPLITTLARAQAEIDQLAQEILVREKNSAAPPAAAKSPAIPAPGG